MNPFEQYEQQYFQRKMQQQMQGGGGQPGGGIQGGMGFGPQTAMAATAQPQKKKKNFLVDQISTVTGTLGAIGGGIAGLGLGSVPGALIGGAGGSALGETLENFLTGEDDKFKNVGKEALLGGVFGAGPIRLAKTGLAAKAALGAAKNEGAELGIREALKLGSNEARQMSLRKGAGQMMNKKATEYGTKQFGLTDNYIAKYLERYKEDPGKTITRLGIGTIDDFDSLITKNQKAFDDLVRNANPVDKNTLRMKFAKVVDEFVNKAPSDRKKQAGMIQDEVDQMVDALPDKIPATMVNQIRKEYDDLVNYAMKNPASSVPYKTDVNAELAGGLREALQESSGSSQLKNTGAELSKLYSLKKEALARAGQVNSRGASPWNLRNLTAASAGGSVGLGIGGPIGMIAGAGLTAAANSAPARRMYTQGALKAGGALTDWSAGVGAKNLTNQGIVQNQGIRGIAQGLMSGDGQDPTDQAGATTLEDAILQSQSAGNTNQLRNPMMSANTDNPMSASNDMGGLYQETPQQSSPYSREALMYDIQRDPQNMAKYIDYYQELASIFEPEMEEPQELNATQQQRAVAAQNALQDFPLLEEAIAEGGALSGLKALPGANTALGSRLLGTENIDAALFNVADNVLRARSGASAPAAEVRNFVSNFLPRPTDSPAAKREKLLRAKRELEGYYNPYGSLGSGYTSRPTTLEETLMQQQGAY